MFILNKIRSALQPALVATFLAVVATPILYFAGGFQWGEDLSQQILVELHVGGGIEQVGQGVGAIQELSLQTTWALVDIGPRVCRLVHAGEKGLCPPDVSHTDLAALAKVIRWVAAAKPRVIVVDVAAVGARAEVDSFEVLVGATPVPVLMAAQTNHTLDNNAEFPRVAADTATLERRDRQISFFVSRIRKGSPTDRLMLPVVVAGATNERRSATLSFAAARAIGMKHPCPIDFTSGTVPPCLTEWNQTERVFSFRRRQPADSPAWVDADNQISKTLSSLYVSAPRPDEKLDAPRSLEGAVVVVGDTRIAARDRHETALGNLSGAEIILNDIRQFAWSVPHKTKGFFETLREEFPFYTLAFATFWFVHVVRLLIVKPKVSSERTFLKRARSAAASVATILFTAAVLSGTFGAFVSLFKPVEGVPNFVTPFLAAMLGAVLEITSLISARLERLLDGNLAETGA